MSGFRSITYPKGFFASVKEIAYRRRDQFAHGGKTINVSFEEFNGKDTFFGREWLRQRGLEKLC